MRVRTDHRTSDGTRNKHEITITLKIMTLRSRGSPTAVDETSKV